MVRELLFDQGRAATVKKAVESARRSLDLRLFEDARNEAAFALELDSNNEEARDILRRCREVLGEETNAGDNSFRNLVMTERIKQERERALVNNEIALGEAEMDLENFGRAIDRFERAVTALRFSAYVQPNDPLRRRAEEMLEQARQAAQQAKQDAQEAAEQVERANNAANQAALAAANAKAQTTANAFNQANATLNADNQALTQARESGEQQEQALRAAAQQQIQAGYTAAQQATQAAWAEAQQIGNAALAALEQ